MTGTLVLVATPIGNLGDLAPRAVEEFEAADVVLAEDTRRTGSLLRHVGVHVAELRRFDEHTEYDAIPDLVERLRSGARVIVVSDAGTPGISDPGERLVAAAVEAGVAVTTVPGPVAAISAVIASGLSSRRFVFEGFLARKGAERAEQLTAIAAEVRTTVFYESPNRLAATLGDLAEVCAPERRGVVARELTKLHEELRRGTLTELASWADGGVKGEVVVVVEGADSAVEHTDDELRERLAALVEAGSSKRDAVDQVAGETGVRRGRVYDLSLDIHRRVTPPP